MFGLYSAIKLSDYQIIKAPADSFKMMYHEPGAAREKLDSTGNTVEIEPKMGNSILARFPKCYPMLPRFPNAAQGSLYIILQLWAPALIIW